MEQMRQLLLKKHTSDIQKSLGMLQKEGLSEEDKKAIEAKIEVSQSKMRELKSAEEKEKQARIQMAQKKFAAQKQASLTPKAKQYSVEVRLMNILPTMRSFPPILECLKVSPNSLRLTLQFEFSRPTHLSLTLSSLTRRSPQLTLSL